MGNHAWFLYAGSWILKLLRGIKGVDWPQSGTQWQHSFMQRPVHQSFGRVTFVVEG